MTEPMKAGALALAASVSMAHWGAGPARAAEDEPAVPVTLGTVVANDVPVFVRGLGAVQAYNAVTIKSRVDGQITGLFFTEGQDVKQGDRLFQIDPRPYQAALDQAIAAKARDEASLRAAKLDLDRYQALVGKGFQTRQSVDEQKGTVEATQGSIQADEAAIEAARLNLDYANIRSPLDGRTGQRLVDPGNLIQASAGTPLVTITQLKPIFVSFTVPQEQLDAIRDNQSKAPLAVEAYSNDDQTKLAAGKLTLIDNTIDQSTGTIRLKASFDNADERLWPGEFINARLVLSVRSRAMTVPAQAVMSSNDGAYVYVARPNNTVERHAVDTAGTENGATVITKGLRLGDRIVVSGQYRLTEGAHINPSPASGPTG